MSKSKYIFIIFCCLFAASAGAPVLAATAAPEKDSPQAIEVESRLIADAFRASFLREKPNLPVALRPVRGYFYRGTTAREITNYILVYKARRPKAFISASQDIIPFKDVLKRRGAFGILSLHADGNNDYATSMTRNVKVAERFAKGPEGEPNQDPCILKFYIKYPDAYPTKKFSFYPDEREHIVVGIIPMRYIKYLDGVSHKFTPVERFQPGTSTCSADLPNSSN